MPAASRARAATETPIDQRQAGAVQQAGEQVAADVVGAEGIARRRRSCQIGGTRKCSRNCSIGEWSDSTSARAEITISPTIEDEADDGAAVRPRAAPEVGQRRGLEACACPALAGRFAVVVRQVTGMADPRVEEAVEQVDAEVRRG
jgi:hypothetical protein